MFSLRLPVTSRVAVVALVLALTGVSCAAAPEGGGAPTSGAVASATKDLSVESGPEIGFAAEFADWVRRNGDRAGVPGLSVVVVDGSSILHAEGFGVRDVVASAPVTTSTLFHIGSTNKAMTSLLVATLVDDGYFDWDTPAIEIYDGLELSDPAATNTVTMSDLLTMSSGIPDSAEDDLVGDVAREVFEVAASSDLLADAGVVFSYSNLAYAVAGYVAVLATGGTIDRLYDGYADLLVRRVLDPIGMTDATVRFSEATTAPDVSKSYEVVDGAAAELAPEDFDGDPLAPSGSVKAGALEMGMFLQTQLSGGIAPDGRRVVSEQNLLITRQPRLDGYAMGWELAERADTPLLSHEGAFDGFMSVIAIAPDLGFGFAILANSEAAADLVAQAPGVFVDLALGSG